MNDQHYSNRDEHQLAQLKTPPHSDEAEEAVIGSLLIDNNAMDAVEGKVLASDFYRNEYRQIFKAIEQLFIKHQPFDYITVTEYLKNEGVLEEIGGEEFIIGITERTLSSSNAASYAKLVRDKSVLRQVISTSSDISELGYFPGQYETKEIIDIAEQKIFKIAEQYDSNIEDGFKDINTLTAQAIRRVQELAKSDSHITGLATGWKDFDEATSGLQRGDLVIVAARPSMGKTAFCLNIALNVAKEQQQNVAIFSLEMPGEQLSVRLMSTLGQINQTNLRTGRLKGNEWDKLKNAVHQLSTAKIFVDDASGLTPTELRSKCRRLARENGQLGLVVVDYLQLMEVRDSNENRTTQVSEISRSLKLLAKEFNVPVVALSQLNRGLESRTDKRPIMSDLRESGAIEQDADVICFIYRDAVYAGENEQRRNDKTAEIIIGKQRNGPIGTVKLTFLGEYTQFVDYAPMYDDVPFE